MFGRCLHAHNICVVFYTFHCQIDDLWSYQSHPSGCFYQFEPVFECWHCQQLAVFLLQDRGGGGEGFHNPEKHGLCSQNNGRLFKVLMATRHLSCEWISIPSDGCCPQLLCFCLSITVYFAKNSIPYRDRQVIHLET